MSQIVIADIVAYDPSVPGTITLRYSTQGYVTKAADTPASTYYDGRIQVPPMVDRVCFSGGGTVGRTQIGFGNMVLVNNDGALDALRNYQFDGRSITIKLGEVLPNAGGVPTWTTIIKGTMEQAEFTWEKVFIRVRDRQQDLAKPLQQNRYGGTNSLPSGLDGVATDIKGRPKPLVFGKVFNCQATLVNTTRRIYHVHDGSTLQSVDAVYDRGATLTAGAAYSSQSDMETNAPAGGQYRVWNDSTGVWFRLGSSPAGIVTFDATRGAAAANRTVGQVFNQILTLAGVAGGDISSADITALDALVAYPVGIFLDSQRDWPTLEALDLICGSVGAWFGSDASGVFRIGRIDVPTGTSAGEITATDVLSIDYLASRDPGVGIPAWKVKLGYERIATLMSDVSTTVTDVRKAYLAQEYRRVEASDAAIKTSNAASPELSFDTQLVDATDAGNEASRRLLIYKTRRDIAAVEIRVDSALASILDLGKIVTLKINRYGMVAGKKFLVVGVRTDLRNRSFNVVLWG